ncbi:MAG: hypothetical protein Q8877_02780, partial [Sweet potato little leaf phytoplasma]|nr:hypothetical protein [Sweet potato little leaf phytoplasma]
MKTKDRIAAYTQIDQVRVLCKSELETMQHLFFSCPWSTGLVSDICDWIGLDQYKIHNTSWTHWIRFAFNKDKLRRNMIFATYAALVYQIWMERNRRCFQQKELDLFQIFNVTKKELALRLSLVIDFNKIRNHSLVTRIQM